MMNENHNLNSHKNVQWDLYSLRIIKVKKKLWKNSTFFHLSLDWLTDCHAESLPGLLSVKLSTFQIQANSRDLRISHKGWRLKD